MSLFVLYWKLFQRFGPQGWWPAETPFEMIVGAILTQNTAWANVEQAIAALKREDMLEPERIATARGTKLHDLVRPAGYFLKKAARLKAVSQLILEDFDGELDRLFSQPLIKARQALLAVRGVGPETADSILLYAGQKPIFVIDAYTKRILKRLGLTRQDKYQALQRLFHRNLPADVKLFQEFHALLVAQGKDYCRKSPVCRDCSLGGDCAHRLVV